MNLNIQLPNEIWRHIAMYHTEEGERSAKVYHALVRTYKAFSMQTDIMQEYYLRKSIDDDDAIIYLLPNGKYHSPNFGLDAGYIHRDICSIWYVNGVICRKGDLPSIVFLNGDQIWYECGVIHRAHDKPAVIRSGRMWYGSVCTYNYIREWYHRGERHRFGKPAVERRDGGVEYWNVGIQCEKNEIICDVCGEA
jgi:hypothetical protein